MRAIGPFLFLDSCDIDVTYQIPITAIHNWIGTPMSPMKFP